MIKKITWTTIASILFNHYIDEYGRCKLCGEQILTFKEQNFQRLHKVYKHFCKKHEIEVIKLKNVVLQ